MNDDRGERNADRAGSSVGSGRSELDFPRTSRPGHDVPALFVARFCHGIHGAVIARELLSTHTTLPLSTARAPSNDTTPRLASQEYQARDAALANQDAAKPA